MPTATYDLTRQPQLQRRAEPVIAPNGGVDHLSASEDDVVSALSSVESALSEVRDVKSELDHLKDIGDRLEEIATRGMAIELALRDAWFDVLVRAGVVLVITAIAVWGWHTLG